MCQVSQEMNIGPLQLEPGQKAIANKYWHLLLFPASPRELHCTHISLKNEAPVIVEAVLEALCAAWEQDLTPFPEENPFL